MNTIPVLPFPNPPANVISAHGDDAALRAAAEKLEATFLSEMLKSAGLDEYASGFGGGVGQEQFASFLRDAQAEQMVKSGGIGLAESLFNAMKKAVHA